MSESQSAGQRGTGEEQDWRGEEEAMQGAPDIAAAGAFPALANESLSEDPNVPTDVDPEGDWVDGSDADEPDVVQGRSAAAGDG